MICRKALEYLSKIVSVWGNVGGPRCKIGYDEDALLVCYVPFGTVTEVVCLVVGLSSILAAKYLPGP